MQDGADVGDRAEQLHADSDPIPLKYHELNTARTSKRNQGVDLLRRTLSRRKYDSGKLTACTLSSCPLTTE
jgi:hypothetical protein